MYIYIFIYISKIKDKEAMNLKGGINQSIKKEGSEVGKLYNYTIIKYILRSKMNLIFKRR